MKPRDGLVLRQTKKVIGCINQAPQFYNDPMWPAVRWLQTVCEDWCLFLLGSSIMLCEVGCCHEVHKEDCCLAS